MEKTSDIILGQEAICPDGLGRVIGWRVGCEEDSEEWIQVSTYISDRKCKWDLANVVLIEPGIRIGGLYNIISDPYQAEEEI